MAAMIRIEVTNESPWLQTLFFFRRPAVYTAGAQVYSNSLSSIQIPAKPPVSGK